MMPFILLSTFLVLFLAEAQATAFTKILGQEHLQALSEDRRLQSGNRRFNLHTQNFCAEVEGGSLVPEGSTCDCTVRSQYYASFECQHPSGRSASGTLTIAGGIASIQLDVCHQFIGGSVGTNCVQEGVTIPLTQDNPRIEYICSATVNGALCASCDVCESDSAEIIVDCGNLNPVMSTPMSVTSLGVEVEQCLNVDDYLDLAVVNAGGPDLRDINSPYNPGQQQDMAQTMSNGDTFGSNTVVYMSDASFASSSLLLLSVTGLVSLAFL